MYRMAFSGLDNVDTCPMSLGEANEAWFLDIVAVCHLVLGACLA